MAVNMLAPAMFALSLLLLPALLGQVALAHGIKDSDILNLALNLEYLEAEFYSWAAFGKGLSEADLGRPENLTIGGKKASLSPDGQGYAEEIARDEINHVRLLRGLLGKKAVPAPVIDIGPAFAAAAAAAFGVPKLTPAFDPYANDLLFYHGAFIFEDVGVTAYGGAAPLIKSKEYLSGAVALASVEAYHAGVIRLLLAEYKDLTVFPYGVTVTMIVEAISSLRDAADGPGDDDQGIATTKGEFNLVPTNSQSLTFARTPAQVLAIVYLGDATKPGGFFPSGLNGKIR